MQETKEELPNLSKRSLKKLKRRQNKLKELEHKNEFQLVKEEKLKSELSQRAQADLITKKILNETEYYFEKGLRKVRPYHYDFVANAKGRWFGRSLVQVFSQEFQYYSEDKCKRLISKGTLRVASQDKTSPEHIICNGDVIINTIHRHELPVSNERIVIVEETDEILVVDKPPSMPIHPCGRYRHNSLLYILAKEHGYLNLRVAHRLDRLTSGLVLLCKTEEKTKQLMSDIRNRDVHKIYLSKVDGVFPSDPVVCEEAIGVLSHKLGVYKAGAGGKESSTTFRRLATDGVTSIVQCEPHTGRTHQIRLHLQFLGHPITNDPTYNHPAWGEGRGKGGDYGKSEQQLIEDLSKVHRSCLFIDADNKDVDDDDDVVVCGNDNNGIVVCENDNVGNNDDVCDNNNNNNNNNNDKQTKRDADEADDDDDDATACKRMKLDDASSIVTSLSSDVINEGNNDTKQDEGIKDNDDDDDKVTNHDNNNDDNDTSNKINVNNNNKANNSNNNKEGGCYDSDCGECHVRMRDPRPEEMFICLHALSYQGPDWKYETEAPSWAKYH